MTARAPSACSMATWPLRTQQGSAENVRAILSVAQGVYAAERDEQLEIWNRTLILTMATGVRMLSNLHCSLKRLRLRHALAAIGQEALTFGIRQPELPTIDLGAISGLSLATPAQQYLDFSQLGSSGLMCAKIGLLQVAVGEFGMDVLLLDTDMVFLHDPLPVLARQAHEADVLLHTGLNTLGCVPTPPRRLSDCRRPEEGSFVGSAAACAHGDGVWNAEQLQCACRAWAAVPAWKRGMHPIPPREMGFLNSGLVWFRSRGPAQRLLRHFVAILMNASASHNDQQVRYPLPTTPSH